MSSETAIFAHDISKVYHIYEKPRDRLLQLFLGDRRKLYREFWALRNISLTINRGETVGILGRNGSGKSSLLQILAGTLTPTSGAIDINGRVTALLELGAGFNPDFTGRENAFLNAAIFGVPETVIRNRFDDIAAFADIGEFIDQPVKTYSSGMYARLAFSVAMSMDPEILIIDEILSVGDVFFQARCMQKMDSFRENGGTILFCTHDTYAAERICTKTVVLHQGSPVYEGNTAEGVNVYYKMSRQEQALTTKTQSSTPVDKTTADSSTSHLLPAHLAVEVRRNNVVTDGSAYIDKIFVCSSDGTHQTSFQVGDWMTVHLEVIFKEDFAALDFGVGIRDKSGILIGGAHSFYDNSSVQSVRANEKRLLTARIKLDVEPREYLLVAGIARHESLQAYTECYGVYDFLMINVIGDRKFWGGAGLPSSTKKEQDSPIASGIEN